MGGYDRGQRLGTIRNLGTGRHAENCVDPRKLDPHRTLSLSYYLLQYKEPTSGLADWHLLFPKTWACRKFLAPVPKAVKYGGPEIFPAENIPAEISPAKIPPLPL